MPTLGGEIGRRGRKNGSEVDDIFDDFPKLTWHVRMKRHINMTVLLQLVNHAGSRCWYHCVGPAPSLGGEIGRRGRKMGLRSMIFLRIFEVKTWLLVV